MEMYIFSDFAGLGWLSHPLRDAGEKWSSSSTIYLSCDQHVTFSRIDLGQHA